MFLSGVLDLGEGLIHGARYEMLCDFLEKHNEPYPEVVFIEDTYIPKRIRPETLELLLGLKAIVKRWCFHNHISCEKINNKTWKKAILGNGNASKADAKKFFKDNYYRDPKDDNEADAYCILHYGIEHLEWDRGDADE